MILQRISADNVNLREMLFVPAGQRKNHRFFKDPPKNSDIKIKGNREPRTCSMRTYLRDRRMPSAVAPGAGDLQAQLDLPLIL